MIKVTTVTYNYLKHPFAGARISQAFTILSGRDSNRRKCIGGSVVEEAINQANATLLQGWGWEGEGEGGDVNEKGRKGGKEAG